LREWRSPWETGLLTAPHECCERPLPFVVGTTYTGYDVIVAVLRCKSCERFSFPPPVGPEGDRGLTRFPRQAEQREELRASAVERAYSSGSYE
jgi:hypothetical protein